MASIPSHMSSELLVFRHDLGMQGLPQETERSGLVILDGKQNNDNKGI